MPNVALIETQQIPVYTVHIAQCPIWQICATSRYWHVVSQALGHMLPVHRRKIKLIEGNAKCRRLKKLTCLGTLWQVFICLWARTPYTSPLTHCIFVYSNLSTQGGLGGELNQREG
jgi:hypothetical protein